MLDIIPLENFVSVISPRIDPDDRPVFSFEMIDRRAQLVVKAKGSQL